MGRLTQRPDRPSLELAAKMETTLGDGRVVRLEDAWKETERNPSITDDDPYILGYENPRSNNPYKPGRNQEQHDAFMLGQQDRIAEDLVERRASAYRGDVVCRPEECGAKLVRSLQGASICQVDETEDGFLEKCEFPDEPTADDYMAGLSESELQVASARVVLSVPGRRRIKRLVESVRRNESPVSRKPCSGSC